MDVVRISVCSQGNRDASLRSLQFAKFSPLEELAIPRETFRVLIFRAKASVCQVLEGAFWGANEPERRARKIHDVTAGNYFPKVTREKL